MNNASIPLLFVAIIRPASRDKRRKGTLRRRKMKTNQNIRKGKMSGKGRVIVQIRKKKKEKRWEREMTLFKCLALQTRRIAVAAVNRQIYLAA